MYTYKFDVEKVTKDCVAWIKRWFAENGGERPAAIVGVSGGKDSAVVAALCAEALGKDNVIAVLMPNGEQKDIADSWKIIYHIGLKRIILSNISDTVNGLFANCGVVEDCVKYNLNQRFWYPETASIAWNNQAAVNAPARIRMATLYAMAAQYGGRVANTCNRSEDVCGYATLYGDSAGDFSPLSKLTVTEVIAIGEYLGLPQEITRKTPSDGLCGKSDEESLGMKYAELDEWLRESKRESTIGIKVWDMWISRGRFKLSLINLPSFDPDLYDRIEDVDYERNQPRGEVRLIKSMP